MVDKNKIPKKYEELYRAIEDHPQIQANILKKCFDYLHLADLKGDYLEFGVWKGDTFSIAYHFSQRPNTKYAQENKLLNMEFYAFDSFKGLPKPELQDKKDFQQEDFTEGNYSCSKEQFIAKMKNEKVDSKRMYVISGWFKETLNKKLKQILPLKKASIVWIDCDLYSSTTHVLNFITNYLVDGSIILFDDWYSYRGRKDQGEQRAFSEWLNKNPRISVIEFQKFGWHGNSFIVHKK